MSPSDDFVRKWVLKADNDLTIAQDERNVGRENIVTDGICFHCQQASEKMLKAFLTKHRIDFKKVHNLEYLAQLCMRIDPDFASIEFGNLSGYGAAIRYPDDFYMPTLQETDECLRLAKGVRTFVGRKLGISPL